MAESRVPRTDFSYSPTARRYRDAASGRFVTQQRVDDALDTVLDATAAQARAVTQRLSGEETTLARWQREMAGLVKDSHAAGAALGAGGWHQLSEADRRWASTRVREQLDYLRGFAGQLASGDQPLNGTALIRAAMYAHAGRATQREMGRRLAAVAGQQYERRNLGAADHCESCLDAAVQGWQPIGSLPAIGDSLCKTNCFCTFEFSQSDPSESEADAEAA